MPKECSIFPQRHMINYVHNSVIHNIQNPGNNLDSNHLKTGQRKRGTYTMEYHSAVKNNIMGFADKWMEIENIIPCEVTQTQKDKH
ncbi:hypothetical protein STEG23_009838, partial [Scotinomys teguina]